MKIADFGISQMLHKSSQKIADAAGTPAFMSPELCEQKSFSGQLADIWAIGITIYMLRYGHPPFMAKTVLALYSKIVNDPVVFPYMIDPGLRNLLENVLEKDPMKRFTLQQIIAHPWLRQPPSISVIQKSQRHPSQQNKGNSLNHFDHAQATADSKINLSFMPPPSYNEQEAAAMNAPVKTVDNHEIYQSIGVRVEKERKGVPDKKGISEADEEESIDVNSDEYDSNSDDEDDENNTKQAIAIAKPTGSIAQNNKYQSTDLMATNWGADVFEMVDDDGDDDDDEDVDSDDDEKKDQVTGLNNGVSAIEASNSMRQDNSIDQKESVRSEMSDEEQALRSKRFMGRRNKKSLENMNSIIDDSPKVDSNGLRRKVFSEDSPSAKSTRSNSGKTLYKFTFDDKARNKSTISNCEDTDDPNQISMEEFESMMDTLAMQPRKGADDDESDDDDLDEHDRQLALNESKALGFSAHLWNQNNGVAAAFHSEQGVRPSQEDRCILLPNVAKMKALEGYEMPDKVRDQLEKFSLACVFDGHSGWRCSQYLSQHLAGELVTHPNFLEKQIDVAIKETFCSIDQQVSYVLLLMRQFLMRFHILDLSNFT